MILRRLVTLTALALALTLGLSGRANASYDTSVSVTSVNDPGGGSVTLVPGPASFVNTQFTTGPTTVQAPAGYATFIDAGGSTIYLVNQVLTNLTLTNGVNESIFVAAAPGNNDTSSWTANLLISVRNPSQTGSVVSFGTSSIAETAAFSMNGSSYAPTGLTPPNLFFTSPTAINLGGSTFSLANAGAAGGNANNSNNNGAISATISNTPEPASVVMLGTGVVGIIGFTARRRRMRK
jgi:hypothetical protein